MIIPRPYQSQAITDIRAAYAAGKRRVMYQLPTGGGKSLIFGLICHSLMQKSKRAMILVHRKELLNQASSMLTFMGIEHSTLMGGPRGRTLKPIVIASVQTVIRRFHELPDYDLIVCDEAHLSMAASYQKIYANWPNAFVLGVTATPSRLDGKGFNKSYDTLISGPDMGWLIESGFLSPYRAYAPKQKIDISEIKITRGDYDEKEIEEKFGSSIVIGDAVSHYRKYADSLPAIAFCVSINHAKKVAEQFNASGYVATHIEGNMDDTQRSNILSGLANGTYNVVTSCNLISEGLDIPVCAAVILLRPTKSVAMALQQIGRCLRVHKNKPHAIILDHAGILFEHGLPDDEREWTLEGKEKKRKKSSNMAPKVNFRHCPECQAIHPIAPQCPRCQHIYIVMGKTPKTMQGDLVEIDASELSLQRATQKKEVGMAKTEQQLMAIAKARGYKKSWVYYVMKSREKRK